MASKSDSYDPQDAENQDEAADSMAECVLAAEAAVFGLIAEDLNGLRPGADTGEILKAEAVFRSKASNMLSKYREAGEKSVRRAFERMADGVDDASERYYAAQGIEQVRRANNKIKTEIMQGGLETASHSISSSLRLTVVGVEYSGRLVSLGDYYTLTMLDASSAAAIGEESFAASVQRAVSTMASGGLRIVPGAEKAGNAPRALYRTKTENLYGAMRRDVMASYRSSMQSLYDQAGREFGADGYEITAHALCARDHLQYQGTQMTKREYERIQNSLARPLVFGANCVAEGTRVDVSHAKAVFRRHYAGNVIRIRTALGNDLTVTPNHPVLTSRGWVAACDVNKGDYVFSGGLFNGVCNSVRPDVDEDIPRIEDSFGSFAHSFEVARLSSSSTDFHGDASVDQNVDVVLIDGELRSCFNASHCKHVAQPLLHDASGLSDSCLGSGSPSQVVIGSPHSPDGIMSGCGVGAPFFFGHSRVPDPLGLATTDSRRISVSGKNAGYCHLANAERLSDVALGHASFVQGDDLFNIVFSSDCGCADSCLPEHASRDLHGDSCTPGCLCNGKPGVAQADKVIDINIDSFDGHVYNLSTYCGWYYANNIITHNCHHQALPVILGVSVPAYSKGDLSRMRGYSDGLISFSSVSGKKMTMSRYDASQYMRSIESKAREYATRADLEKISGVSPAKSERLLKRTTEAYRRIVKETGLPNHRERIKSNFDRL